MHYIAKSTAHAYQPIYSVQVQQLVSAEQQDDSMPMMQDKHK